MNKILNKRIPMELKQLKTEVHGISCSISDGNLSKLMAMIPGPKGSPYEEGYFKISITLGPTYPFRPPTMKFETPVYHPNIDRSGKICLDILRVPPAGSYNPAITLESILLSIQLLLATPNPDDPLRGDAADLYKSNLEQFNEKARQHVKMHCMQAKPEGDFSGFEHEAAAEYPQFHVLTSPYASDKKHSRIFCTPLQTFDQHEDAVCCVEWSYVDPYTIASIGEH